MKFASVNKRAARTCVVTGRRSPFFVLFLAAQFSGKT